VLFVGGWLFPLSFDFFLLKLFLPLLFCNSPRLFSTFLFYFAFSRLLLFFNESLLLKFGL
jgi:hypothetical protein